MVLSSLGMDSCRLCGGPSDLVRRYDIGRLGGYWSQADCDTVVEIRRCARFGSFFTSHLPQPSLLAGQYATRQDYENPNIDPSSKARRCVRLIREFASPGARLIDIGGGNGAFALAAQQAGFSACLQELGSPPVKLLDRSGVSFVGDLSELDSRSFDIATLWDVYEHVWPHDAFLAPIRRILKTNGLLAIEIPSPSRLVPILRALGSLSASPRSDRMFEQICNFTHLQLMTAAELRHTLPNHGFEVVHFRTLSELSYKGVAYADRVFPWRPVAKAVGALFDNKRVRKVLLGDNKTFVLARLR